LRIAQACAYTIRFAASLWQKFPAESGGFSSQYKKYWLLKMTINETNISLSIGVVVIRQMYLISIVFKACDGEVQFAVSL
jgi:hypothetical protein